MNGYETSLVYAVGLAHLAAAVCMIYFRLFWRFPVLSLHLLFEGAFQLFDGALAGNSARDLVWVCGQAPRIILRAGVAWEVWKASTLDLDPVERKGLGWLCGLFCLLAGAIAIMAILVLPTAAASQVSSALAILLLIRQYLLLIFAIWLGVVNLYLLWTATTTDHNLTLYRLFSATVAIVIFGTSSFVKGGLGYHFLPYSMEVWSTIHIWQCWYMLILIAMLALFLKSEALEAS